MGTNCGDMSTLVGAGAAEKSPCGEAAAGDGEDEEDETETEGFPGAGAAAPASAGEHATEGGAQLWLLPPTTAPPAAAAGGIDGENGSRPLAPAAAGTGWGVVAAAAMERKSGAILRKPDMIARSRGEESCSTEGKARGKAI